ncbi:MAG: hemolysin family protein [Trichlorobacter sp.]|nr:hemolysin family protein [Trichlorobacter sp.]
MDSILIELLIILFLIATNGFFSMSEFAIISSRKSRIAQLVAEGDERAVIIERYQQDPHTLLAVIQIGVTVAGSAASTVGGIVAIQQLRPVFAKAPWTFVSSAADPLAAFTVIATISFITLIIGELVPKALGLQFSDRIALSLARPMRFMAAICKPLVTLLTFSSKSVLKLLGIKGSQDAFITREEVQHMVLEGHESGIFSEAEHEYIRNIFEFTHTCVREVMIPRTRMVALEVSVEREELLKVMLENQYSRYPVYRDSIEEIIGVVHDKDLISPLVHHQKINLETLLRPPIFVPEAKRIDDLLKEMQLSRNHMALVVDEYGGISGLVTTEDLLEELVGEIEDEHDTGEPGKIVKQPDGSWLVDGLVSVFDLQEPLHIKLEDDPNYDTLAGLILNELGRLPKQGEALHWMGYKLVCKQVTRTAVLRVRIIPEHDLKNR